MPEIGTRHRLFFGVPVPAEAASKILQRLPGDIPGRVVPPEKWHFTLRFAGFVDDQMRDRLAGALGRFDAGPGFSLSIEGLGAFPAARRARVLWLGATEGADRLADLAHAVEMLARREGLAPEERAFRAHLTLARLDPPRSVAAVLESAKPFRVSMPAGQVILYRSVGGRYEPLATASLS